MSSRSTLDLYYEPLSKRALSCSLHFTILVNFQFYSLHIIHSQFLYHFHITHFQQLFIAFTSFYMHVLFLHTCYILSYFQKQHFKCHMHRVLHCGNVVLQYAAEKWTLTLVLLLPPLILALRWYRHEEQFISSLASIMSLRPAWAM